MTCLNSMKTELQPRNFGLDCHRHDLFYKNQWGFPPIMFLVYRVVAAVYMVVWLIIAMVWHTDPLGRPSIVWLTYWSFIVLCCHLVFAAVIQIIHLGNVGKLWACADIPLETVKESGKLENKLPWYIRLDWILYTVSLCAAPLVTLVYFTTIFPVYTQLAVPKIDDFHIHGVNSIVMFIEVSSSAIPTRVYHFVYFMVYGLLYLVFTVVYWALDHNKIMYSMFSDWNNPGRSAGMSILLLLVVLPVIHLLTFLIYKLRVFFCKNICCRANSKTDHAMTSSKQARAEEFWKSERSISQSLDDMELKNY